MRQTYFITLAVEADDAREVSKAAEGIADSAEARIMAVSTDFATESDFNGQPIAYLGGLV